MDGNQIYKVYNFILVSADLEPKIAQETCTEVFLKAELTETSETLVELFKYAYNQINQLYPTLVLPEWNKIEADFEVLFPEEVESTAVATSEQNTTISNTFKSLARLSRQVIWLVCVEGLSLETVEFILNKKEIEIINAYTDGVKYLINSITPAGVDVLPIVAAQHKRVFESIKKLAFSPELLPQSGYKQELTNLLKTQKPATKLESAELELEPQTPTLATNKFVAFLKKLNWKNLAMIFGAMLFAGIVVAAATYSLLNSSNNNPGPSNTVTIQVQNQQETLIDFVDAELGIKLQLPASWTTTSNNEFAEYPEADMQLMPVNKRVLSVGNKLNFTNANLLNSLLIGTNNTANNFFPPVSIGNKLVIFNAVNFPSSGSGCAKQSKLTTYYTTISNSLSLYFTQSDNYDCIDKQLKLVDSSLTSADLETIKTVVQSLIYTPQVVQYKDYQNSLNGFKTKYPSSLKVTDSQDSFMAEGIDIKPGNLTSNEIVNACEEFKQINLSKLGTQAKTTLQASKNACIIYPAKVTNSNMAAMVFKLPTPTYLSFSNANYWMGFANLAVAKQIFDDAQTLTPTSVNPYPNLNILVSSEYVVWHPSNYVATLNNSITPYTYKLSSPAGLTITFSNQITQTTSNFDYKVLKSDTVNVNGTSSIFNVEYLHQCPATGPVCPPASLPINPVNNQVIAIVAIINPSIKLKDGSAIIVTVEQTFSPTAGAAGIAAWDTNLAAAKQIINTLIKR